jgi:hypothetical protein
MCEIAFHIIGVHLKNQALPGVVSYSLCVVGQWGLDVGLVVVFELEEHEDPIRCLGEYYVMVIVLTPIRETYYRSL